MKTGSAVCFFNINRARFHPVYIACCPWWELPQLERGLVLMFGGNCWEELGSMCCLGSSEESEPLGAHLFVWVKTVKKGGSSVVIVDPTGVAWTLHFLPIHFPSSSWDLTYGGWKWGCCCSVAKLCPTLCDPIGWSMPGSSVYGIIQSRILEWVASTPGDLPDPGLKRVSPALAGDVGIDHVSDWMSYNSVQSWITPQSQWKPSGSGLSSN